MQQETEIPDIRFWGLKVAAGKPATYSIENDQGMLELCHLTNVALGDSVALVNASTAPKPIYVRVRSPDAADEYTLGALVPGRIYSFSTDLMITPDTEFSHTGAAGEEVHLTGYRSFSAEAMLDDFNESGDESSSDGEGSSGDEDFVNADGSEDASSGDDESDEAQESGEEDDDMVAMQEALRKNIKQKARVAVQQAGPIAAANGMALEKRRIAPEALDGVDDESEGSEEGLESESDLDLGSFEDDEDAGEDADAGAREKAVMQAEEQQRRVQVQKARQRALDDAEGGDDFDIPMRDAGDSAEEGVSGSEGDDGAAGHTQPHLQRMLAEKGIAVTPAETAPPRAKSTDKKARKREEASPGGAAPQKKAKTASGKGQGGALPEHPEEANAATRQYVEQLVTYLREHGGEFKMSQLGIEVKRPEGAHKMGKILKTYDSWFRRSGDKGKELMVLRLK